MVYQKKEFKWVWLEEYTEYIDDEKTISIIIIMLNCLIFDHPFVFISNKEVLHEYIFPFFSSRVNPMPVNKSVDYLFSLAFNS